MRELSAKEIAKDRKTEKRRRTVAYPEKHRRSRTPGKKAVLAKVVGTEGM